MKLLHQGTEDDQRSLHAVLPIDEKELHVRAEYLMRSERPDHNLQPTALVNVELASAMPERFGEATWLLQ